MLELINELDEQFSKVFLVGHNPTFTHIAEQLSGDYFGNLPTCGIIGIRFSFTEWKMISEKTGDNFYYGYPKRYQ
jgi:phosphohistidine phosphatase